MGQVDQAHPVDQTDMLSQACRQCKTADVTYEGGCIIEKSFGKDTCYGARTCYAYERDGICCQQAHCLFFC